MENNNTTGNTPQTPQTNGEPNRAEGTEASETELRQELMQLKQSFNSVAAELRRIKENRLPTPEPRQEQSSLSQKEELAKLQGQIIEERNRVSRQMKEAAIMSAISGNGYAEEDAQILFDHILARHGDNVKVDGINVHYEDPVLGEKKTVSEFVKSVLKAKGDKFRSPVVVPQNVRGNAVSNPGANGSYSKLPQEVRNKMPQAERNKTVLEELRRAGFRI